MYEADDVNLTKSEYEVLRAIADCGWVADESVVADANADTYRRGAYQKLESRGYIMLNRSPGGTVTGIYLNGEGKDWLASYDASVEARNEQRRHDFKVVIAGALAGGLVSLAVESFFHLPIFR